MVVIAKPFGANLQVDLQTTKKLRKPLVEKRRRERMNRSLECLRVLLLRDTQHRELVSGRVQKAEVLEHTVLFLQNTGLRGTADGTQQQDFQDGFSTCLQRAAHFLQHNRQGQRVEGALSTTLSRHLTHPGQLPTAPFSPRSAHTQPERQCAQLGPRTCYCSQQHGAALRNKPPHLSRTLLLHTHPTLPQHPHTAPLPPPTESQPLWRPWP